MIVEIFACLPLVWLVWKILQKDPAPVMGVYSQRGCWYYIKYIIARLILYFTKKYARKSKTKHGNQGDGYGRPSHERPEDMEKIQPLSKGPKAIDTSYFAGADKDGTCFIARIGRCPGRTAQLWLFIALPDGRIYQHPLNPGTVIYNTNEMSYSAAGLKMECLEPMRKWKITYNGLLREGLCNEYPRKSFKTVHVVFSFIWTTFTDVFNFDVNCDQHLLADALAREPWTKTFKETLKNQHQTHYEQWGELHGTVKVDGHEDQHLYLRSIRDCSFGYRDWRMFHRYIICYGRSENGTVFHVSAISWSGALTHFQTGYLSLPNATMMPITSTDLKLPFIGENHNPPENFSFSFTAGSEEYKVNVTSIICPIYYHEEDWGNIVYEKICHFEINGLKGYGISEFGYRRLNSSCPLPPEQSLPLLREPSVVPQEDSAALILAFTQAGCCCSRLVGGKGCQLALLTQLQSKDFVIPAGFCLTLKAFEHHVQSHPHLAKRIVMIEDIASGKSSGSLEAACTSVCEAFTSTELSGEIRKEIASALIKQFGSNHGDIQFAVRSSASGEDGAEMSAAGQMDTFLGVKGLHQLFTAIIKCWASEFALTAVEYRRQHGQPVLCGMGVVIQKMVPAEAAGVLFTCDPVTGNPASMIINANYGLGESVVSGSAEPDTITIARSWDNQLSLQKKQIGCKKVQILLTDSGGIESKPSNGDRSSNCCLSDEVIIRLGEIGIELEKRFSDPRDIEFAISDGIIYLLQARPITGLDQESDWDIMHEFDSALCHDKEIVTTANIGEMMPSAMTPLTLSMFIKSVDFSGQMMMKRSGVIPRTHDFLKFLYSYNNMGFINLHMMIGLSETTTLFANKRMAELSILGETLPDFSVEEVVQYHRRRPFLERAINGIKMILSRRGAHKQLKKWELMLDTYTIADRDWTSASQLYAFLTSEQHKYIQCWTSSLDISSSSAIWATLVMSILSQGKHVWTTEYYSDIAMMLSQCEYVYSADVPIALQKLAESIQNSGYADHLLSISAEEGAEWLLKNSDCEAGKNFKEFLSRHGHRCVKEAELLEKSWQSQPHKIINVIQAMLSSGSVSKYKKVPVSVEETLQKLKTPTTWLGRIILRWALPKARQAVGYREWGKSVAVQMSEVFKQGYWKLATLMVRESRLPREELLFFLTHQEIGQLLETRCGHLITKAQRRSRIYPKQLATRYKRVNKGRPVPIDDISFGNKSADSGSLKLKGMPVSQGVIQGTARVISTLKDAAAIQSGDILVVPFTDVGWSPYFPLISGLVTEMGGLLSHGAVVAREYGLPCIVNVPNATKLFSTGDEVILNGTKGTLELLT